MWWGSREADGARVVTGLWGDRCSSCKPAGNYWWSRRPQPQGVVTCEFLSSLVVPPRTQATRNSLMRFHTRVPLTQLGRPQQLGAHGPVGDEGGEVPQLKGQVHGGVGHPDVQVLPAVEPGGGGVQQGKGRSNGGLGGRQPQKQRLGLMRGQPAKLPSCTCACECFEAAAAARLAAQQRCSRCEHPEQVQQQNHQLRELQRDC